MTHTLRGKPTAVRGSGRPPLRHSSFVTRHWKVPRLRQAAGLEEAGVARGATFQPGGAFSPVPLDEVGQPDAGPALEGRGHRADGVGGKTVEEGGEEAEG